MNLWDLHVDYLDKISDPRVKGWFLMDSPFPTMFISFSYAFCATIIGPLLMANKKPFELRGIIIFYNFVQVVISTYLFCEFAAFWFTTYSFRCQPVDYSDHHDARRILRALYLYYLSKFSEFLDTLFFILRKNNRQISALHVIHHMSVPMTVWWGVKFAGGGHSTFFSLLNTFVHIVMYTYYMLAALGPHMKRYLWWKSYLTVVQMIQFTLFGLHAAQLLFIECDYSRIFTHLTYIQAILFLTLFYNFYNQNYKQNDNLEKFKWNLEDFQEKIFKFTALGRMCFPDQEILHRD